MTAPVGSYLFVLPVPGHRVAAGQFAIESAFAHHLRQLRDQLGGLCSGLVVASPSMPVATYEASKHQLEVIDEAAERITFHPMFAGDLGRLSYLLRLPGIMRALYQDVRAAAVVHAGPSLLYRPFEFPALLLGRALGKKTISVTDIDNRNTARMNYDAGRWSWRQYLVTRVLHEPYQHLQHLIGVRAFSLVLLKGGQLAADYGQGRPNVKNFLDSAYSAGHIIDSPRLEAKLRALVQPAHPLALTFFGRLVAYKGIDHMLRAVHHAVAAGATGIHFHVIGDGPERGALERLAAELGITGRVTFHGAVPFGEALFERLYECHVLLAAPINQDTPRSALDALASGQALIAYDTYYYRELGAGGAPVELVPWQDFAAMGTRIAALDRDRGALVGLIRQGVAFARDNTQEAWLQRRSQWTRDLFGAAASTSTAA